MTHICNYPQIFGGKTLIFKMTFFKTFYMTRVLTKTLFVGPTNFEISAIQDFNRPCNVKFCWHLAIFKKKKKIQSIAERLKIKLTILWNHGTMLETGYNFSRMWSNDLEVDNLIQESENYSLQSPGEPCSTLTFKWYICVHPHKKVKLFRCFTKIKKVILRSTKNTTIQKNILLNAAIGPGPTWNEKYVTFKYKPHRSLTTGSQHLRFYLIYRWKKEWVFITALQAVI